MDSLININEINKSSDSSLITLKELCEDLSVSVATGRNWIKLGKLTPSEYRGSTPLFERGYAKRLKESIRTGENTALKSRRNKKYVSGNSIYNAYVSQDCRGKLEILKLLSMIGEEGITLTEELTRLLLADCALKLILDKTGLCRDEVKASGRFTILMRLLKGEISVGAYDELIFEPVKDRASAIKLIEDSPMLFGLDYSYEKNEDVLGLLYISCINIGNRKSNGAYFTPSRIVLKMIKRIICKDMKAQKVSILDPCCGTGNFLMQLPSFVAPGDIYGYDIDPLSVMLTRLNLALKYGEESIPLIKENIQCFDFLAGEVNRTFDIILGNPPWGYEFSADEKKLLKKKFFSAAGTNIESYDVFIENSIKHLGQDGILSFVLPEAVLNVRAHRNIREFIRQGTSMTYLEYLGDAFDKVQCPCIILNVRNTGKALSTRGLVVKDKNREYEILTEREASSEYFSFLTTDEEYSVLQKLLGKPDVKFLKDNADFALGIVTGNNREYISDIKNDENEIVYKGSDINRFYTKESGNYITFRPESFQQVAPTALYRAKEKLFYRFISSSLIFAYDDKQSLSLNSCNIVIPRIEGISIKYILAVLNSSAAEFVFEKVYNSVKVLRSHIEGIPIPVASDELTRRILEITDKLITLKDEAEADAKALYHELDELVFDAYGLDASDRNIIYEAVRIK